jgi:hypothetical protein
MVILPFPPSRAIRDRLTEADQADLFARWPKGDVIEVETAVSTTFNCFLATDDSGDYEFVFWREPEGQYVREDTGTGRKVKGARLAEVMPAKPGVLSS